MATSSYSNTRTSRVASSHGLVRSPGNDAHAVLHRAPDRSGLVVMTPLDDIIRSFHMAIDRGRPGESLPDALRPAFIRWVETHYPDVHANADEAELEGYLIDENEGVEPMVAYFKTIPAQHVPGILASFRARIEAYYANTELDPADEMHAAAIEALAAIARYR
jgi:hypothetical protein